MKTYEELENGGMARILWELEIDNYFDVYGEPETYLNDEGIEVTPEDQKQAINGMIENEGLWVCIGQIKCKCCGGWETVDSMGMLIGRDDNGYLHDIKQSSANLYNSRL